MPKQALTLTIDRLSDDGRGIAKHNVNKDSANKYKGKSIFVDGALPGETVLATLTKENSKYSEARVKEIITPSVDRVPPPCGVYHRCGGCSMQHMEVEQQLLFKQATVLEQLSRWSDIIPSTVLPPIKSADYGYRQRVRFAVNYTKTGELSLGFREANSQRLVNLTECIIVEPILSGLLPLLRQWLLTIKPNVVSHIECVNTAESIGLIIRHTRVLPEAQRKQLHQLLSASLLEAESVQSPNQIQCWFQSEKRSALESVDSEVVDPRMSYQLGEDSRACLLHFHPQDFIQANAQVNQAMVAQALELMAAKPDEHIVDLFCGIGNFSLPLARVAGSVTGVEGVEAMVQRARANTDINGIDNAQFVVQDLSEQDMGHLQQCLLQNGALKDGQTEKDLSVDGLLLDPPRSGAKEICQNIKKLAPKRIVYVSCDSATFSRDAKILAENGYHLSTLGVMDMFPQTAHIETMGLFVPSDKKVISKKDKKTKSSKKGKSRVYAW